MKKFILLVKKYNLEKDILRWAGAFRYLQATNLNGFSLDQWIELNSPIDIDLAKTIFRILVHEELILITEDGLNKITDEISFQRDFEMVNEIVNFDFNLFEEQKSNLLWTIPNKQISLIPRGISEHFHFLYSWIQELILTSNNRIVFISPYFSENGIRHLLTSLDAINNNKKGIVIDFLVNDMEEKNNSKAFTFLSENIKLVNNNKIRIYEPIERENDKLLFHAKLLLVDGEKGYLGSANYSERGLSSQFEIGIPMRINQIKPLMELVDYWINNSYFKLYKQM